MSLEIRSKFSVGFIIQHITVVIVFMILPILGYLKNDGTDNILNTDRYLIAFLAFVWIFGGAILIAWGKPYFILLTDNTIKFKGLSQRTHTYNLAEIVNIKSRKDSFRRRTDPSVGYNVITLIFTDGKQVEISENDYQNFGQMRSYIYRIAYNHDEF